jgi:hypothetical protein
MARILYVGQVLKGSTAHSRANAIRASGHDVTAVNGFPPEAGIKRAFAYGRRRWGVGPAHPVNREILRLVRDQVPDVLWLDKALNVTPATLRTVHAGGARVIQYTPDDCRIRPNVSHDMLAGLAECDLFVTSKVDNIEWLKAHGARGVLWSYQGFDEEAHRPPPSEAYDAALKGRVVFVGAWEPARAATITSLLRAGIPVTVTSAWKQWAELSVWPNFSFRYGDVFGVRYAAAHASADVSLGFLRKAARDEHTTRTFEIPACGGVMLAERTEEQTRVFREGVEAEFFADDDECIAKCRGLMLDAERRESIRRAGRRRCLESGYSWRDRCRTMLDALTGAISEPSER